MKRWDIKRVCIAAGCIALCYVLPVALHGVALGSALSPMHIPVLLCGLACGGGYGVLCGLLGPILSHVLSGMPPVPMLVRMIPELMTYGLAAGLFKGRFHSGKPVFDLYASLILAMLLGRIVGGVATAIFFLVTADTYSVKLWVTGYFVEALPGIVAHLLVVPALYRTLRNAGVIPVRKK
jgi:thiamine transporter ThiT